VSGEVIYAGGWFSNIGGQARGNIAALDASTGAATSWNPNVNGNTYALAASGGIVLAGGAFMSRGISPITYTLGHFAQFGSYEEPVPRVTLTPAYLRFVEPNLDTTTAPQAVTVTNSGSAPLIISEISLPVGSDFAQTNNCPGGEIAVGGFCTINVTFTPTANGIRKGPLTIVSNGAGSPHLEPVLGVGGIGRPAQKIGIYRSGWYFLDLDGSQSWSSCSEYGGGTDACFTGFGGYPGDIPIIGAW
jgi:hypothetical protein